MQLPQNKSYNNNNPNNTTKAPNNKRAPSLKHANNLHTESETLTRLDACAVTADKVLMAIIGVAVFLLLLFSGYSLYDMFYTESNALASRELLQYKPSVSTAQESEVNGFDDLLAVNEDAIAWLTVYDTHIDYPVVQGKDNYEYANKDVFGQSSLTGTLYLSSDNNRHFQDNYSIIYGHHMDNGGMFGDIAQYYDRTFFEEHTDGFLQTLDENYRLTIFAFMVTDAYDYDIYFSDPNDATSNQQLWQRIQNDANYMQDDYKGKDFTQLHKLIALSTCEDATTNGRIVLFAEAIPGEGRAEAAEENGAEQVEFAEKGEKHLALLNLLCSLLTLFVLLPVLWVKTKYRQLPYAANRAKALAQSDARMSCDMRRFVKKAQVGLILEIALAAVSVLVFLETETLTAPLVLGDDTTWIMLLILIGSYVTDVVCFRYRGKRHKAHE